MDDSFWLNVGLDSIGFYAPRYRLSLNDLAKKRGIDPNKFEYGLLAKEFAVPDYGEDSISMAIMAARNCLARGNEDPKTIDAIFVGTESLPYAVKPIASILSGFLNVKENTFTGDTLHACAGATLGLLNAVGLVNSNIINKALVIGTDISRYPLESPGEPTQGAGAVAMIITKNPRIAKIGSKFGKVSGHVNDFFRTLYSENAEVFGKYSTISYLKFVLKAYDDFKSYVGPFLADYYVFHAPFGKMPMKSFQKIIFERWLNNPEKRKLMIEKYRDRHFSRKEKDIILSGKEELVKKTIEDLRSKGFSDDDICKLNYFFKDWLKQKLLPCLDVPIRFGNMYSASLWAQLIHIIETRVKEGDEIYFTSYGSGATAISGMFKIQPGFKKYVQKGPFVMDYIRKKSKIPIEHYELYKRNLLNVNIHLCELQEDPDNKNGMTIYLCNHGCVLPNQEGIALGCTKGHKGVWKKWYPDKATIKRVVKTNIEPDQYLCDLNSYITFGDVKPGMLVELSVRRLKVDDEPDKQGYGLIHWHPVYVPVNN
ncbi:MAG: hydroxymethylglutaryl-CoA synthase family protein [Promethearchaeota archaeon]